jgi:hypothetical protein
VRPAAAQAFAEVFGIRFKELPSDTVAQIRAA